MESLRCCLLVLALSFLLTGCQGEHDHEHSHSGAPVVGGEKQRETHYHSAPHGGALVVLGQEFSHVEFVLEPDSGTLNAYILDGEAEGSVRIPGGTIDLIVEGGGALSLQPVVDELTGETLEDTSHFRAQSDFLKGREKFEGSLLSLKVKGQEFQNVDFRYPEGNEDRHDHDSL